MPRPTAHQKYEWNLEDVNKPYSINFDTKGATMSGREMSQRNMVKNRLSALRRGELFSKIYQNSVNEHNAPMAPETKNWSFNEPTNLSRINSNLFGGPTSRRTRYAPSIANRNRPRNNFPSRASRKTRKARKTRKNRR